MRGRSRIRTRGRTGSNSLLSQATAALGAAPYHYWDFTTNRALFAGVDVGAVASTPGWSFTRASTGYAQTLSGLLVPFASGVPRRTDKGLLVEEARTNVALQSQTMSSATWAKAGTTINANAYGAPDATTTMDGIQASAGNSGHYIQQGIVWTNAIQTVSAYVRYVNHQWIAIGHGDGTTARLASFDLLNGVAGAVTNVTSTITSLGGGVYFVTLTGLTANLAAAGNISVSMNSSNTASLQTWNASGTEQIGVWGIQAEAASGTLSAATSYIPTTTVAVTRAADVPNVATPGTPYPNTMFVQFNRTSGVNLGNSFAMSLDAGANDRSVILATTVNQPQAIITAGGIGQFSQTIGAALAANVNAKVALRTAATSANVARDNVLGTASGAITAPASPTTVRFGVDQTNANPINGYVLRSAVFSTGLADAALQRATL